jgi:hypothetical protein
VVMGKHGPYPAAVLCAVWVPQQVQREAKDPLNSAFLKGEVRHRTNALCGPAHLTVALAQRSASCAFAARRQSS